MRADRATRPPVPPPFPASGPPPGRSRGRTAQRGRRRRQAELIGSAHGLPALNEVLLDRWWECWERVAARCGAGPPVAEPGLTGAACARRQAVSLAALTATHCRSLGRGGSAAVPGGCLDTPGPEDG